ncbi:MAG: HAMP domain-containing histidine kinase [Candidatus Pacebacteria bacterium]|nr:HAMP domain-containing histidine kinase [Candidatus Paceibacterota bacterium]
MDFKEICKQLNIFAQCRNYKLSLWQCPQFLFIIMGFVIGSSSLILFAIGTQYITDPTIVALIVLIVAVFLLIISFLIIRSFEKLAEANQMKSEFVGIVSHQFRSPISNLKWCLELLSSGKLGRVQQKQVEYFKILKENIDRMNNLASDLIIVSRLESSDFPLEKKQIFLEDLVKNLIKEFGLFAKASNVEIEFRPNKKTRKVFADPDKITEVIENLLDNAIKYTKEGRKVKIQVKEKSRKLYFEIKDQGVGIVKKDQKYIFQKFFRSKSILHDQTQGSGLGLFIAKAIIKKSGGEIGFKSMEGKGSTFWFTLPIN